MNLKAKAETFRALHNGNRILVLANAWDVASARIVEAAGAPAIATTSAGVANVLGYPDGEKIPRALMIEAAARIAAAVEVPVTADVEAGYGPGPDDAAETARQLIAAGIVGMNFEDSTGDPENPLFAVEQQTERIRAIRQVAAHAGVPLFLNARTDVFLAAVGEPATRFDETVRRAQAYRNTGADCIFVPGVVDAEVIAALVKAIGGPINILASPGVPSVAELERLGVARVSTGSAFMRATFGRARKIARDIYVNSAWETLFEDAISYPEMNQLLERNSSGKKKA